MECRGPRFIDSIQLTSSPYPALGGVLVAGGMVNWENVSLLISEGNFQEAEILARRIVDTSSDPVAPQEAAWLQRSMALSAWEEGGSLAECKARLLAAAKPLPEACAHGQEEEASRALSPSSSLPTASSMALAGDVLCVEFAEAFCEADQDGGGGGGGGARQRKLREAKIACEKMKECAAKLKGWAEAKVQAGRKNSEGEAIERRAAALRLHCNCMHACMALGQGYEDMRGTMQSAIYVMNPAGETAQTFNERTMRAADADSLVILSRACMSSWASSVRDAASSLRAADGATLQTKNLIDFWGMEMTALGCRACLVFSTLAFESGFPKQSLSIVDAVQDSLPNSGSAHAKDTALLQRAACLFSSGDLHGALAALSSSETLETVPQQAHGLYLRGAIQLVLGENEGAKSDFAGCRRLEHRLADTANALACATSKLDNGMEEAMRILRHSLAVDGACPVTIVNASLLCGGMRDPSGEEQALSFLEKADIGPRGSHATGSFLSLSAAEQHRAIAVQSDGGKRQPKRKRDGERGEISVSGHVQYRAAKTALLSGKTRSASLRFEALSSPSVPTPNHGGVTRLDAVKWVLPARQVLVGGQMDAHVEMAQALVCEQEYSRALETLARVPEALGKPSNASLTTLETKARALAGLGRHQESLQVIDQLIAALKSTGDEDKNRVAEACCSRGVVLASMVAHDAALESFKEARLLCPGHMAASFNAALVLFKTGRQMQAAKLWLDARAIPQNLSIKECRERAEMSLKCLREMESEGNINSSGPSGLGPSEKQVMALDVRMFESWASEMEAVEACVMVDE